MRIPPIADAVVVAQDPDNYAVKVSLPGILGGQGPAISVRVLTHGPRDAVRGSFPELPAVGTHGIVAFTRNDLRNGRWIGSSEPAMTDASPYAPGVAGISYAAYHAGGWTWTGPDGTEAKALADGTTLLAGASMPSPTRHTVDGGQNRRATPFTAAERNPNRPGAFPLAFSHPSGASATLSAGGTLAISVPAGQPFSVTAGTTSIAADAAGNVLLTTAGAAVEASAAGVLTLKGTEVTASTGGPGQAVRLADGSASTVLMAE